MKKNQVLVVMSLILSLAVSGKASPTALIHGYMDLGNMVTAFEFQGTSYVSDSYGPFNGYLKALGEPGWERNINIEEQGSYGTQIPGTYVWTSIDSEAIQSSISLLPSGSYNTRAVSNAAFSRYLEVSNLKQISVEYWWNSAFNFSTDEQSEYVQGIMETSLSLYSQNGLPLVNTKTYASVAISNGNDTFASLGGTGLLSYTFDSPFSGILNMIGIYDLTGNTGFLINSVPEPGSSGFLIPSFMAFASLILIRNRTRNLINKKRINGTGLR